MAAFAGFEKHHSTCADRKLILLLSYDKSTVFKIIIIIVAATNKRKEPVEFEV